MPTINFATNIAGEGIEVWVDTNPVTPVLTGYTPLTLNLSAGVHNIQFARWNAATLLMEYVPPSNTGWDVNITGNGTMYGNFSTGVVTYTLDSPPPPPTKGTLLVSSSPPGAHAIVSNVTVGQLDLGYTVAGSDISIQLDAGTYTLTLTLLGYIDSINNNVVIAAGQEKHIDVVLQPTTTTQTLIKFSSNPLGATVKINSNVLGITGAVPITYTATPGTTYNISIELAGYITFTQVVTPVAGSTTTINPTLTAAGGEPFNWTPVVIIGGILLGVVLTSGTSSKTKKMILLPKAKGRQY